MIFTLCLLAWSISSQTMENPRFKRPHGITLSGAGPGLYGSVSYNYFIKPTLDLELGAGPVTLFGGVKYHLGGAENKNLTPYFGGYAMYIWIFDIFDDDDNETPLGLYVPIGIQYTSLSGFTYAVEIAGLYAVDEFIEWGSIKFGYRF